VSWLIAEAPETDVVFCAAVLHREMFKGGILVDFGDEYREFSRSGLCGRSLAFLIRFQSSIAS
jgi:hypothetical protein